MNYAEFEYRAAKLAKGIEDAERELEATKVRIARQVADELLAQRIRKAREARKSTGNAMVDETARRGILAQAESEESQAKVWDSKADHAHQCMMATSNRDLINYYVAQEAEFRRKAQDHRDAADAHRKAAAKLGI
jgi:hypothetical protein